MKDQAETVATDTEARRTERQSSVRFRDAFALAGLIALIAVGGVLALSYDGVWITGSDMAGWIDRIGTWGPVAIVALMVLHCFVPFPAEFVVLCAGAVSARCSALR